MRVNTRYINSTKGTSSRKDAPSGIYTLHFRPTRWHTCVQAYDWTFFKLLLIGLEKYSIGPENDLFPVVSCSFSTLCTSFVRVWLPFLASDMHVCETNDKPSKTKTNNDTQQKKTEAHNSHLIVTRVTWTNRGLGDVLRLSNCDSGWKWIGALTLFLSRCLRKLLRISYMEHKTNIHLSPTISCLVGPQEPHMV